MFWQSSQYASDNFRCGKHWDQIKNCALWKNQTKLLSLAILFISQKMNHIKLYSVIFDGQISPNAFHYVKIFQIRKRKNSVFGHFSRSDGNLPNKSIKKSSWRSYLKLVSQYVSFCVFSLILCLLLNFLYTGFSGFRLFVAIDEMNPPAYHYTPPQPLSCHPIKLFKFLKTIKAVFHSVKIFAWPNYLELKILRRKI